MSGFSWLHYGFNIDIEMVEIVYKNAAMPTVDCPLFHLTVAYDTTMYDAVKPGEIPDVHCPGCFDVIPLKKRNEIMPPKIDEQCHQCKIVDSCDHGKGSLPCIAFSRKIVKKETFKQQSLAQFVK